MARKKRKDEATQDNIEEVKETEEVEEEEENSSSDDEVAQNDEATQDDEVIEDMIEEVEEDHSSLLASLGADLEFLQGNNTSFYQANKAYYEDRDYEGAIAEFQAAIEYEKSPPSDLPDVEDSEEPLSEPELPNDVLVKSMYWMGEAYLKLNQTDQAVETFGKLSEHYNLHYLAPAARRRIASLTLDKESESA